MGLPGNNEGKKQTQKSPNKGQQRGTFFIILIAASGQYSAPTAEE